jgi:hypothetical protein
MGRRNKKMIQEEMIREGEEVTSAINGFLLGLALFIIRVIVEWTRSNPALYMISLVAEAFVVVSAIVGALHELKYGGWIMVKYLLVFVGTYLMFRIIFFGWP